MTGLELAEDNVEVLHCLFGELDAIHDEQHALGVACDKKPGE